MRVLDEALLETYRAPGKCWLCGKWFPRLEAHHSFVMRGMAGGCRVDLPENLSSLCASLKGCHQLVTVNKAAREMVRCVVAERCGATVEQVYDWLFLVLRTPREKPIPERPWRKHD